MTATPELRRRIEDLERELSSLRTELAVQQPEAVLAGIQEVLLARLGPSIFGLSLESVLEVLPRVELLPVADAPQEVAGHLRWRGRHIPVLDLGVCWRREALPVRLEDRIIVLRHEAQVRGLLVEQVEGVAEMSADRLSAVDDDLAGGEWAAAIGDHEGQSIVLLKMSRVFTIPAAESPAP